MIQQNLNNHEQRSIISKYQQKIEQIAKIRLAVNSPKIQSNLFTNNIYYPSSSNDNERYFDDIDSLYRRTRSKSLSYLTDKKIFRKRSNSVSSSLLYKIPIMPLNCFLDINLKI